MTKEGMLVQAFIPTARDITVKLSATGKQYQMEMADETGFFAALIPRKTLADYTLLVFYDNGTLSEIHDPYSFAPQFTESDLKKFEAGVHYSIYNKMVQIGGKSCAPFPHGCSNHMHRCCCL